MPPIRSRERSHGAPARFRRHLRERFWQDSNGRVLSAREQRKIDNSVGTWHLTHCPTHEACVERLSPDHNHVTLRLPCHPLPKNHFRLLDFTKSTGPTLVTAPVHESRGTYVALSYCWGGDGRRYVYSIDDNKVAIGSNLYDLLDQVHLRGFRGRLWIDALCINQCDPREQDEQLPLMPEIYSNASQVLIWLGYDSEDADPQLEDDLDKLAAWSDKEDRNKSRQIEAIRTQRMLLGSKFGRLFHLPWFERMWTLQETVLARELVVWYRDIVIPWQSLVHAARLCRQPRFEPSTKARNEWSSEAFFALCELRQGGCAQKRRMQEILFASSRRKATEPNDHVYALLGLISNPNVREKTSGWIDSSRPFETTFMQFAKIIASEEGIDTVLRAASGSRSSAVPSWCPDFSDLRNDPLAMYFRSKASRSCVRINSSLQVHESKTLSPSVTLEHLCVWGTQIGTISEVVHPPSTVSLSKEPFKALLSWTIRALMVATGDESIQMLENKSMLAAYSHIVRLLETQSCAFAALRALCINMVGDASQSLRNLSAALPPIDDEIIQSWLYIKTWADHFFWRDAPRPDDITQRMLMLAENQNVFFRTSDGRLGMGPPTTRRGDRVCHLDGLEALCILRDSADPTSTVQLNTNTQITDDPELWHYCGIAYIDEDSNIDLEGSSSERYLLF